MKLTIQINVFSQVYTISTRFKAVVMNFRIAFMFFTRYPRKIFLYSSKSFRKACNFPLAVQNKVNCNTSGSVVVCAWQKVRNTSGFQRLQATRWKNVHSKKQYFIFGRNRVIEILMLRREHYFQIVQFSPSPSRENTVICCKTDQRFPWLTYISF